MNSTEGPGDEFLSWTFFQFKQLLRADGSLSTFRASDGSQFPTALDRLRSLALDEKWYFGEKEDPKYPILWNYLRFTFFRQKRLDGGIVEKGSWATFNTGLVNKLYDPIFALFEKNPQPMRPWMFHDFCVPGIGPAGKTLTKVFAPLPEPARYFASNFDMVLDTTHEVHLDHEHVIIDGVSRDRLPIAFLEDHKPKGMEWVDYRNLPSDKRKNYLDHLGMAIQNDTQCMRGIKNRLEDAKALAVKRSRWNFKTAIPQYHPRRNEMSLLLPLAIVNDEKVDVALVVTRNPSGSYQGRTILPLPWAYSNARLVCRPNSDWLTTDAIRAEDSLGDD